MRQIYLEEDDEIISVIDKIKNVSEQNMILVCPNKSPLIRSIVNLKILKRQSDILQKNISISTNDEIGKMLAEKAKLKVFESSDSAGNDEPDKKVSDSALKDEKVIFKNYKDDEVIKNIEKLKKTPTPEVNKADYKKIAEESKRTQIEALKKKFVSKQKTKSILLPSMTAKILLGFFGACFVIGIIAIIFLLPQATIYYSPKTEPFTHDLEATLIKNAGDSSSTDKKLSYDAETLQKNSDETTFPATGQRDIGTKSKGQIVIYNKYSSEAQPLVASTRFTGNNGKIYRLTNDINVPGATIEAGKTIAGKINATIEADVVGSEYNIDNGAFAIPGLPPEKQVAIYAESLTSITGGDSKKVTVITADDIKKAKEDLTQKTSQKIIDDYKTKLPSNKIIVDSAIKNEILDTKTNGEENKEAKDFKMTVTVKSTIPFVVKDDLQKVVFTDAKSFMPENKQLLDENLDSGIKFETISFGDDNIKIKVSLQKKMFTKINEQEIKDNLVGKTVAQAQDYLMTNPDIFKADVNLWPFWVHKVPHIKNKINLSKKELN